MDIQNLVRERVIGNIKTGMKEKMDCLKNYLIFM